MSRSRFLIANVVSADGVGVDFSVAELTLDEAMSARLEMCPRNCNGSNSKDNAA